MRLLGLGGASDFQLWDLAIAERCVLVTKDEDFVKLSVLRGPPPKVLWLNAGNVANSVVSNLILQNADAIEAFVAHPELGVLARTRSAVAVDSCVSCMRRRAGRGTRLDDERAAHHTGTRLSMRTSEGCSAAK